MGSPTRRPNGSVGGGIPVGRECVGKKRAWRAWLGVWFVVLGAVNAASAAAAQSSLVIVIDGLRPDYITRELMPTLTALGEKGAIGEAHHAVFPTVTRVNSTSIATGSGARRAKLRSASARPRSASSAG